jgi:hypothetical protein
VNLTVSFDLNTLGMNISIDFTVYCKDNSSNTWVGKIISRTELFCFINYSQHNSTLQNIQVVLKTPSYSSQDILLSLNYKPLYYLTQGLISFASQNQTQFEYVSTYLPVNVTLDTYLPNELKNNLFCKLSDSNVEHLTYISTGNYIICNFTTSSAGSKNLSIWYKDSYHKFQLSINELELIFTKKSTIVGFSPLVIRANQTKDISTFTNFETSLNYGSNFEYYCEYGVNATVFTKVKSTSSGMFICPVKLESVGKSFMKIYLKSKNILKLVTTNVEYFQILGKKHLRLMV